MSIKLHYFLINSFQCLCRQTHTCTDKAETLPPSLGIAGTLVLIVSHLRTKQFRRDLKTYLFAGHAKR